MAISSESNLCLDEKKKWAAEGIDAAKTLFSLHPSLQVTALYYQLNFEMASEKYNEAGNTLNDLEKRQDGLSDPLKEILQKIKNQLTKILPNQNKTDIKNDNETKLEETNTSSQGNALLRDVVTYIGGIALISNPIGSVCFFSSMILYRGYQEYTKKEDVSPVKIIAKIGLMPAPNKGEEASPLALKVKLKTNF